jgi:FkbM family methyltransferase
LSDRARSGGASTEQHFGEYHEQQQLSLSFAVMSRRTRLTRVADIFNHAPLWHRELGVWRQQMASASFDRWLYLLLHSTGCIGRSQMLALQQIVRPGMTVLDVGANLGLYTVLISRLVGPTGSVIAFEPDPDLFVMLKKNCIRNGCANVTAHNVALGSGRSRLVLHKRIFNAGANTLGAGSSRFFLSEVEVDVVSVDEFLPDLQPNLIKIDVQGWEFEVLRGMHQTMAANPNIALYLEYWPTGLRRAGSSPDALLTLLIDQGFKLYLTVNPVHTLLDKPDLAALTRRLTGFKYADLFVTR